MASTPFYKNLEFIDGNGVSHKMQLKLLLFDGDRLYIQLKEPCSLLVRRKDLRLSSLLKRDFRDFIVELGDEAETGLVSSRHALRKRGLLDQHTGALSEEYMSTIRVLVQLLLWLAASPDRHVAKDKMQAQLCLKRLCEVLLLPEATPSRNGFIPLATRLSCQSDVDADGVCCHLRGCRSLDAVSSPQSGIATLLLNYYKLRGTCSACVFELSTLLDQVAEGVLQSTPTYLQNVTEAQVIRDAMQLHRKRRRMDEHFRTEALSAKLRRTSESHVRIAVAHSTVTGWVQAKIQSYLGACRADPADRLVLGFDGVRVGGEETLLFLAYNASKQSLMWLPVQWGG
eukprot:6491376-Amphidinium_carterae.2